MFSNGYNDFSGSGERALVLLPGGRSIGPMLEQFMKDFAKLGESERAQFYFGLCDERCVQPESDDRNMKMLRAVFFAPLVAQSLIGEEQILDFDHDPSAADRGAASYYQKLQSIKSAALFVVCGAGEDGHICSLFPGRAELELEEPGVVLVTGAPKPPSERVSITPGLLKRARATVGLFLGEGKREAYRRFVDPETSVSDCPAKLLRASFRCLVATDLHQV